MNAPSNPNPFLAGNFAPVNSEDDFDLVVTGEIPKGLVGSLYRNGPNPQFPPKGAHHWFHGDGMVHAFHLDGKGVRYSNRFVWTPKWSAENRAGFALDWADIERADPAAKGANSGIANTNILWHGGRLLALEENHAPFELEPNSLASIGFRDFGGHVTAHPKIDPETGEMVFFAYGADGILSSTLSYGVADRTGAITRREKFAAPYCSMIHDFLVTRDHVLFPVLPLTGDAERAGKGLPAFAWEPERGAFVGVMARKASVDTVRWFEVETGYVYHVMNAWDEAGAIVADLMLFPSAPLFPNPDGSPRAPVTSRLARWTFDLSSEGHGVRQTYLDDLPGDFPRFDERFSGLKYRHGWFAGQRLKPGAPAFDRLVHIDLSTGARQIWELPDGDGISEPVFVARSPMAEEGDGWILAVAYRAAENSSELVILEARDIARGPVATARVPRRVPFGFHGNWRAAVSDDG